MNLANILTNARFCLGGKSSSRSDKNSISRFSSGLSLKTLSISLSVIDMFQCCEKCDDKP